MSKYFDGELLNAYEDLNKEFQCKKENVKLHQQISDLEAKLAEKEKEIDTLKDYIDCKGCIDIISKSHQDKISFAVEQLEKVKEWTIDFYGEYSSAVIVNFIDRQIKQLKEGK